MFLTSNVQLVVQKTSLSSIRYLSRKSLDLPLTLESLLLLIRIILTEINRVASSNCLSLKFVWVFFDNHVFVKIETKNETFKVWFTYVLLITKSALHNSHLEKKQEWTNKYQLNDQVERNVTDQLRNFEHRCLKIVRVVLRCQTAV